MRHQLVVLACLAAVVCASLVEADDSPQLSARSPLVKEAIERDFRQAPSLKRAFDAVAEALDKTYQPEQGAGDSVRFKSTAETKAEPAEGLIDDTVVNLDSAAKQGASSSEEERRDIVGIPADQSDPLSEVDAPSFAEAESSAPVSTTPDPLAKQNDAEQQAIVKAAKNLDNPIAAQDASDDGKTGSDKQLHALMETLDKNDEMDDDVVSGIVQQMVKDSKDKKMKGLKATVVTNSNVLNHKSKPDPDKQMSIEERIKKTKEQGAKSQRENEQKDIDERSHKDKEQKAKRLVRAQREQLRKQFHKEADEQSKKENDETTQKRSERDVKTRQEIKNKQRVEETREKAQEKMEKARTEMNHKRVHEDHVKTHMEKSNKHVLEETEKQGVRDRQLVARELEEQRADEENKKRQQLENEQNQKREWQQQEHSRKSEKRSKEEAAKNEKLQQSAEWCDCYTQNTDFQIGGRQHWGLCRDGYLITGFYRGPVHDLSNLFYFRCCRPCTPDGTNMATTDCMNANWWGSFDSEGWSMCPNDFYMQGVLKNHCNPIYCLEEARCCKIAGSRGPKDCGAAESWARSFDSEGWSYLQKNRFMRGLYRSAGQQLYNIEYPYECSAFAQ